MIARLTHPWFDAAFIGRINPATRGYSSNFDSRRPEHAIPFAEAQGLILWCPCGFGKPAFPLEGGRPHAILVPFHGRGVPDGFGPHSRDRQSHPRWTIAAGTTLEDLTLTPSIDAGEPSCWHGFITNGEVR